MSLYEACIPQMKKMLNQLDKWLTAGEEHAKKKSFDPSVLVNARLAPDMYPLLKQVQAVCDSAKFAAARLAGKEPPKHPDTEVTMEQLHARIHTCIAYLDTFKETDFHLTAAYAILRHNGVALGKMDFIGSLKLQ